MSCCLAGRRQQQSSPVTWQPVSSSPGAGGGQGEVSHQMAEQRRVHSQDPSDAGGTEGAERRVLAENRASGLQAPQQKDSVQ